MNAVDGICDRSKYSIPLLRPPRFFRSLLFRREHTQSTHQIEAKIQLFGGFAESYYSGWLTALLNMPEDRSAVRGNRVRSCAIVGLLFLARPRFFWRDNATQRARLMDYLPIFLDIKSRNCMVAGGGDVAARKVALLIRAGATVTIVAPRLCDSLAAQRDAGVIEHRVGEFAAADLDGMALAIAATDDARVNRELHKAAMDRDLPVNVVDQPDLCSFIMPAVIDRDPLIVAVSSGGTSPVMTRLLRARIESVIPAGYGRLARFANEFRSQVARRLAGTRRRTRFWEQMLEGPVSELVLAGHQDAARNAMSQAIDEAANTSTNAAGGADLDRGEVYLVGAGPGDADLLTFRALRLMQKADVVLYDKLVPEAVLDLVRRDARRIDVGKRAGKHTLPQGDINQTLVDLAGQGLRVLRLKGGDPFIFGRGGEEIATLAAHGVPFQVVPGITAAAGCASYAGIPLTHRDHAQSCLFVTGHASAVTSGATSADTGLSDGLSLNWEAMTQPFQTLVIYMGLGNLEQLQTRLIEHGMDPETPAALVENGTQADQRVVTTNVAGLAAARDAQQVKPPALVIIGGVVTLRDKLAWFGTSAEHGSAGTTSAEHGSAGTTSAEHGSAGTKSAEHGSADKKSLEIGGDG